MGFPDCPCLSTYFTPFSRTISELASNRIKHLHLHFHRLNNFRFNHLFKFNFSFAPRPLPFHRRSTRSFSPSIGQKQQQWLCVNRALLLMIDFRETV